MNDNGPRTSPRLRPSPQLPGPPVPDSPLLQAGITGISIELIADLGFSRTFLCLYSYEGKCFARRGEFTIDTDRERRSRVVSLWNGTLQITNTMMERELSKLIEVGLKEIHRFDSRNTDIIKKQVLYDGEDYLVNIKEDNFSREVVLVDSSMYIIEKERQERLQMFLDAAVELLRKPCEEFVKDGQARKIRPWWRFWS